MIVHEGEEIVLVPQLSYHARIGLLPLGFECGETEFSLVLASGSIDVSEIIADLLPVALSDIAADGPGLMDEAHLVLRHREHAADCLRHSL